MYVKLEKIILALFCVVYIGANDQIKADTIKKDILTAPDTVKKLHPKTWTLIPPAGLIAYGASSFFVHPLRRFDYYIYSDIQRTNPTFNTTTESYFQFWPIIMEHGL